MESTFNVLWILVKAFAPLYAIVGIGAVAILIFKVMLPEAFHRWRQKIRFRKGEEWNSDQKLLKWLRDMKPSEFEDYTADLFNRMGFHAKAVGKSHDGGIDVIAEKDGIKHYIQCKKYKGGVGVHDMRDFYGTIAGRFAEGKGYFVTTGHFTREAEAFAEDKPIELVDGMKIIRWIRKFGTGAGNPTRAEERICPKDGGRLVLRNGKQGEFYGCSNFPKCHHTEDI